MKPNHADRIKLMDAIFKLVPEMSFDRALEGACGDGRLSKDLLVKKFNNVDLFDIDEDAIEITTDDECGHIIVQPGTDPTA